MRVTGTDHMGSQFDLSVVDGIWQAGSGDATRDLSGLYVLPGLVDAHAHLSADTLDVETFVDPRHILERARRAATRGVLDVVDKGWNDDTVLQMVRSGRLATPRVQAAGVMIHPHDGYWKGFGTVVDGDDLIEACAGLGRDRPWVKIVGDWPRKGRGALPNYRERVLAEAVAAAHDGGARVAIHTMAPDTPSMTVRAGVDSIEHGLFLSEADLEALADRDGMWVPTVLRMHEVLAEMRPGSSGAEVLGQGIDNVSRLLPIASELGVTVLAGSDLAIDVGDIGREVAALNALGLPIEDAVAGASYRGRSALGIPSALGPGTPADLVAFDVDPTEDPQILAEPRLVIAGGEVLADRM